MKLRPWLTVSLCWICLSTLSTGWARPALLAGVDVTLGSPARVTQLFAYPNNCAVVCYRNWSLAETVEHYLKQSLQRDNLPMADVKVTVSKASVVARFRGVPADYGQSLLALLNAGDIAFKGAVKLNTEKKWAHNWYFFLPLGMALKNRKSVELLHFPPDYSLTQAQDYLESRTTDRWAALLELNGVAKQWTPAYQTIIDIAPIAAPASAGNDLAGVYGYFTDYQTNMVTQLTKGVGSTSLPMVAFGAPVHDWIKQQYGVHLPVLGLSKITVGDGRGVSVLGANHPSYIWYAADPAKNGGSQPKADQAGIKVMAQDLVAACWQAKMGAVPAPDPTATLSACQQAWPASGTAVCEQFHIAIRNDAADKAKQLCASPQ